MTDLSRRSFLRNTALAGLGTTIVTPEILAASETPSPNVKKKIIIAGGGIGGLCTGYELMKRGHDVVVMEASGRHGGHVFTVRDGLSDGLYGDGGAEHFTSPGYERYRQYVKELGVTALPYPRRKNLRRMINKKFYDEKMLADPSVLKELGFNAKEVDFLSKNPFGELPALYLDGYLDNFKDEYQPFGVGYDHLEEVPMSDIYRKAGASEMAMSMLGGNISALFGLWQAAILKIRGVAHFPLNIFRLKGGNQALPDAFAKKLADRVWLNCVITSIENGSDSVTVKYKHHNEEKSMTADHFVCCIPPPAFRSIPVSPAFSKKKQYVLDNITYDSYQRFVFQASSKFWEEDGVSINMDFDHPDLWSVWHSADEVNTHRVIVLGTGAGGVSPQRALQAFRDVYPGKKDTIEQALGKDWTKETYAFTCERLAFPKGELANFWPEVMRAEGRIHFAGAYADNLNWGMEAATRSAYRVASEIDKAAS